MGYGAVADLIINPTFLAAQEANEENADIPGELGARRAAMLGRTPRDGNDAEDVLEPSEYLA